MQDIVPPSDKMKDVSNFPSNTSAFLQNFATPHRIHEAFDLQIFLKNPLSQVRDPNTENTNCQKECLFGGQAMAFMRDSESLPRPTHTEWYKI